MMIFTRAGLWIPSGFCHSPFRLQTGHPHFVGIRINLEVAHIRCQMDYQT
jgi:hypothetical protein